MAATIDEKRKRDRIDRALIRRARAGDARAEEELVLFYSRLVRFIAHGYFYPGAQEADAEQEGFVGFTLAIRDFDLENGSPFAGFAELCVRRHVITGLKSATRLKHLQLSHSTRTGVNDDGERTAIVDLLPSRKADPHQALMEKEAISKVIEEVAKMTTIEREALIGVMSGVPYSGIIEVVGGNAKRVDNAVQRARRRLSRIPELEAA